MSAVMSPQWDDDDQLLDDLRGASRGLPLPPPEFVAAAQAAWTWRTIDAELALATLRYDSAADPGLLTRTRSGGSARTLAFAGDDVTIELELTDAGVAGQVSPGGVGQVVTESTAGGGATATVDEIGCFLLATPPAGPFRLCARGVGYAVVTDWISVRH
jgi:hypothetical protein